MVRLAFLFYGGQRGVAQCKTRIKFEQKPMEIVENRALIKVSFENLMFVNNLTAHLIVRGGLSTEKF